MDKQEWILKRNCSLSPRQLAVAYAVLCIASLGAAVVFTLQGAWHVFAFAVVEMAAVATAFIHYARHATDHEHIMLIDGYLLIECNCGGKVRQIRLNSCWTRIAPPARYGALIRFEEKGKKIEVGRYVTEGKRKQIAEEIREKLRDSMFVPAPA